MSIDTMLIRIHEIKVQIAIGGLTPSYQIELERELIILQDTLIKQLLNKVEYKVA